MPCPKANSDPPVQDRRLVSGRSYLKLRLIRMSCCVKSIIAIIVDKFYVLWYTAITLKKEVSRKPYAKDRRTLFPQSRFRR